MHSGSVLLKCVNVLMLMKEGNDVILQDIIPLVKGIHSAMENMVVQSLQLEVFDHKYGRKQYGDLVVSYRIIGMDVDSPCGV